MEYTYRTPEEWIELVNNLRIKLGVPPWRLERKTINKTDMYRVLDVSGQPINPLVAKRFRRYSVVEDMLSVTFSLLAELVGE